MFYVSFKLYLQDCKTMHVHGSHPLAPFISFDAQVMSINLGEIWPVSNKGELWPWPVSNKFTPLIEILLEVSLK